MGGVDTAAVELTKEQFSAIADLLADYGGDIELLRADLDRGRSRLPVAEVIQLYRGGLVTREEGRMLVGVVDSIPVADMESRVAAGLKAAELRWGSSRG